MVFTSNIFDGASSQASCNGGKAQNVKAPVYTQAFEAGNKEADLLVRNAFTILPDNKNGIFTFPGPGNSCPNLEFSSEPKNGLDSILDAFSGPNTGIKIGSFCSPDSLLNKVSNLKLDLHLTTCKIDACNQSDLTPNIGFCDFAYNAKAVFVKQKQNSVVVLVNQNNGASFSGGLLNHQKVPQAGTSPTAGEMTPSCLGRPSMGHGF
ncbi:hypothetical protein DSO57_1020204 [Entomophthora muscae]|uniref:Uncharacterized protein n=1 Tax=Entomophthora muscae TaxID=34485 RepID=A0ACC2SGI7_9FUNG|nr:hypothetical protein DSO57_1020204 [Entomophthora muscae]